MKKLLIFLLFTSLHAAEHFEIATFAGGCFWCVEHDFDQVEGVVSTTSGYMGGQEENPTYKQVSDGETGHAEVVQVVYNPDVVNYETLLNVYWKNVDPTVKDKQFCDVGPQYRSAIFTHSKKQQQLAEASKASLKISPIYTEILPAGQFWPADDSHQNYYEKNPIRYKVYRYFCGRDKRLQKIWGKESLQK